MANGTGEILKSHADTDCASDPSNMEDTVEFRLVMAYATRRRPRKDGVPREQVCGANDGTAANGTAPSQMPVKTEKNVTKRKRKGWKHLLDILKCVKPQTEEEEPQQEQQQQHDVKDRCGDFKEEVTEEKEDKMAAVARRLTRITDEIEFSPPELETDSPDAVEMMIGLILRDAGDRLNEQELRHVAVVTELLRDYSFFESVITNLLRIMGLKSPNPDSPGPHASPKTQIAVACEATTRLSALDTLPMNKLLGFGATYLNTKYENWAQQKGGYESTFESDDEDDVE